MTVTTTIEATRSVASEPSEAPVRTGDWFSFKWWYKGRTKEGNTLKLTGRVNAKDASEAAAKVERAMRAEHPDVRWMQGRDMEGVGDWKGCTFGPTVQKMKKLNGPYQRPQ